jgi:hypothetical protein
MTDRLGASSGVLPADQRPSSIQLLFGERESVKSKSKEEDPEEDQGTPTHRSAHKRARRRSSAIDQTRQPDRLALTTDPEKLL